MKPTATDAMFLVGPETMSIGIFEVSGKEAQFKLVFSHMDVIGLHTKGIHQTLQILMFRSRFVKSMNIQEC